ncbi:restriction endonuclease subunit S [uncultured Succiniclasticum sp.]|uniref:restriction endonuclease subunit S n=1 Tax=uncultured Succiniclasticum sp. TaxID=1500547 RepID=UPI0025ED08B2|nr:restriction endonuclease subunit S [uncultured Succiniclasticum sp.]
MMKTNRRKPSIRFRGFTDDWEQRKLGDLSSSFEYGLNAAAKKYDGENKYIRITDIDDDSREFVRTDLSSPDTDLSNAENYRLSEGDILFARTGASVGKSYIYRISDGLVYYAGFLIKARIKNFFNPEFVFQNTLKTDYERFIKVTSIRSGQPGVNAQEYAQYEIMVPSRLEQDKVSTYMNKLDNLITLHQRKYDKLLNIKKSMLEKMFPKNDSKFPEIRFRGFTDAWEQRKLSHYLDVSTEKNVDNNYTKDDVLSVSGDYGIVNQIEFKGRSFAGESVSNYGIVKSGDVVYTKSPLNSNPFGIIKANKGKAGIVSTLYAIYHPKNNVVSNFIQNYFEQNARVNNYLHPLVNKGAKNDMKVSSENALKGIVVFPGLYEQTIISSMFAKLDNLITLHQRKLEKLKNIKKSMLEKMFV